MFNIHNAILKLLQTSLLMALSSLTVAQTIEINGELFRDPTQPPGSQASPDLISVVSPDVVDEAEAALSTMTLRFVRSGGINPVAVINNQTLSIGDSIEGAVVTDIGAGSVTLDFYGIEHELSMFSRPVRQAVK